nr:MAG TPA: metallophosphoesterase, DNA ligase-associated [Caudoviricetes sp.]
MMSYFDHRIQEHIVESADGEYVLEREKLFTETTSDRVVKKENGDKYVDLSVHNEKPYGLDLLKEAVTKNPWLGCDYHIEPGESLKFAKVINKFIDTDDHFIFLGDFDARHHDPDFNLLKTFFGALKCRNVYLILGNNDSFPIRKYKELGIRAVTDTFEFENVVMTHFPVDVKAPKINIHGHLHGAGSPTQKGPKAYWYADPKRCVDVWRDDFTPLRLNDVLTHWKKMQKYESHYDGKQRLIGESVEIDDYGIPELKKYPLDTKQHVISAIKLFGHVDKEHEQELADNIIKKIEYYNLKDEISVGDDNRFKKYFDDYFSEEVLDELRGELFEENVLISRDDIYYDFDKFESGEKNVLLITGFSGSGKSTLAEQLASKYKCDYFMIDSLEYYGERYMTLDNLKKGEPGCYEFIMKHPKIKETLDGDYSGKDFWGILCQYIPWLISWCKKRKSEKFIIEGLQLYETISGGDVPNTILKNPFIIKGTSGLKSAWRAGKRAGGKDLPAEFLKHIKWAFHDNKMIEGLKKALDEEYSKSTEDIITEEADYNQKNMYPVYIILTDADSPMAKMIKRYTGQPYAHALISFNEDLEPAYSFGCTSIKPLKFGFISKGEEDPFRNEEKAAYVVYAMYVTKSQYTKIQKRIQWFIDNKDKLDYAWGGLAFFGLQIPKQFKNQYFCSQFVMQIIGEAVPLSKDPSLWSPGDIEYLTNISLVDKGDDLRKFDKKRFKKNLNYLKHHQFDRLKMALESGDYFMEAEETLNPTTSHFLLQKIGKRVDAVLADPKNVRTFVNLVQNFINRNITKLTKSGPCDMIPFTDTDHEAFHKLFGFWYTIDPRANKTSPNEIRDIIDEYSKRAHIKCDFWKNNSSLMLFYFVIRYFTMKNDSKNLNTALAIYTLCNYPVMFHKYFPNGVMEPYMQYTIDNMTEKFIIKKSKHLFDALMTSIQASYKFHKGNFASATDKKVGDWINRIRNDQNSMMKKISNEYMKNYKAGNAARTSNEEYDGDTPIVDELENGTTVVQNLVQRVTLPIIEDGVDLVRAEAAAKMSQVSVSDCRYFLTLIITDSNADTIQKFIESLLFLYIYEGKKTERDIRSQYFLAWSASLFKKTNSKNKNINTINEILNFWAESTGLYKKFAGKTSRINYKKAIFFYLVLCIQKNV